MTRFEKTSFKVIVTVLFQKKKFTDRQRTLFNVALHLANSYFTGSPQINR